VSIWLDDNYDLVENNFDLNYFIPDITLGSVSSKDKKLSLSYKSNTETGLTADLTLHTREITCLN
jgi:hypothetical protein